MRKHGIYGVVIAAALLGAGLLSQRSGQVSHPIATVGLADASYQNKHQTELPANVHPAFVQGTNLPQGLLHQTANSQTGTALAALTSLLTPPPPAPKPVAKPQLTAAGIKFIEAATAPKPKPAPAPAPPPVVKPPPPPPPQPQPAPAPVPVPTPTPTTTAPAAPSGGVWLELRECESSDDYQEDSGNGYYGAYQFSLSTWLGLGYGGLPSNAPPSVQDQAAQRLQARSGWGQWPVCSVKLGL